LAVLAPPDVCEDNQDSYVKTLKAYDKTPLLLVKIDDQGTRTALYTDPPVRLKDVDLYTLEFGHCLDVRTGYGANYAPSWPPQPEV
jgi:hypothetical protein